MEHNERWAPTSVIAKRVREVRKRRGLTAEDLANRLVEQGIGWQRSTVAKLENGKRENVTVTEWLALAYVLGVAPVHLLVDPNDDEPFQITPEHSESGSTVRAWVRGSSPAQGVDTRTFSAEVPEGEFALRDHFAGRALAAAQSDVERLITRSGFVVEGTEDEFQSALDRARASVERLSAEIDHIAEGHASLAREAQQVKDSNG
ncbi:helix-turn-helix transcriptional regulator [Streptomyces sp. SAJ15]|uniref:helix-turn-helix transcriptional regulator n=1 Tax=Streptomyces sp. SAJ15 TaxID=2011095 RepID=UPI001184E71D|nr:helix-turn-helix transcriptional regulator [Streptomyces sp. SAJ15]TVL91940.1 hypothetical protein CD790_14780 [Streptomyces sp. SAJ15]